jgi:hypothetical protein
MNNFKKENQGFLELIVVIIIALVLLHVLGIDIKTILSKPWVKDFFSYMIAILKLVWQDILEIVAFIKGLVS